LDAGRFFYSPIKGSAPSIGSLDKDVSATKMHWNVIAEFNHHKKKVVDVIVKYNVHSRDNYEYRWVTFIEMEVAWCDSDLYKEAQDLKNRMIATAEGLKSKDKYLSEELEKIHQKVQNEKDNKARDIVKKWKEGLITRQQAACMIYDEVEASYNYVKKWIGSSWETAKKYVTQRDKQVEEGILSEEHKNEVIN